MDEESKIDKKNGKVKSEFDKDKYDVGTVQYYEAQIDLKLDKRYCKSRWRCTVEDRNEKENQI